MTAYACILCEERHGRMTSLSISGCIYFDCDIPTNKDGSYGCPQCAINCCALCANELDGICPCGGEFVGGVWYEYNGDGRLPDEITQHTTLAQRLSALDELRSSRRMIRAEHKNYARLIELCDEFALKHDTDVQDNPGYHLLVEFNRTGGLSPIDAWGFIYNYAVPSNVNQMLAQLDDRCIECIEQSLSSYPIDDDGWQKLEQEYDDPKYHPADIVPHRSASEMVERDRRLATIVRNALVNRKAK